MGVLCDPHDYGPVPHQPTSRGRASAGDAGAKGGALRKILRGRGGAAKGPSERESRPSLDDSGGAGSGAPAAARGDAAARSASGEVDVHVDPKLLAARERETLFAVERENLLNMTKITVKMLIESTVGVVRPLDETHQPLRQLVVILEHILQHGVKHNKRTMLGQRKGFWGFLESAERAMNLPAVCSLCSSVSGLPGIRTHVGRGRAWIRLALANRQIADIWHEMADCTEVCCSGACGACHIHIPFRGILLFLAPWCLSLLPRRRGEGLNDTAPRAGHSSVV